MATGKKAMLEITKMKITPALSAEHQRKWDESRWECKMDNPERNYDKSRAHLNFEVRKGAVIAPVDKSVCIKEKVDARRMESREACRNRCRAQGSKHPASLCLSCYGWK